MPDFELVIGAPAVPVPASLCLCLCCCACARVAVFVLVSLCLPVLACLSLCLPMVVSLCMPILHCAPPGAYTQLAALQLAHLAQEKHRRIQQLCAVFDLFDLDGSGLSDPPSSVLVSLPSCALDVDEFASMGCSE